MGLLPTTTVDQDAKAAVAAFAAKAGGGKKGGGGGGKKKAPSLLEQAGSLVTGTVPGLFGLAKRALNPKTHVASALFLAGKGLDKKNHIVDLKQFRQKGPGYFDDMMYRSGRMHEAGVDVGLLGDMTYSMGSTFARTGNAAASLAPGGLKPTDTYYAQASRNGAILPTLVEDVGNAAMIGTGVSGLVGKGVAGVSRAAKAATLAGDTERAASLAARAERLGALKAKFDSGVGVSHKFANAPIKPIEWGAGKVLRAGKAGVRLAERYEPAAQKIASVRTRVAMAGDESSVRDAVNWANREGQQDATILKRRTDAGARSVAGDATSQEALILAKSGQGHLAEKLSSIPDPVIRQRVLNDAFGVEGRPSEAAVQMASGYRSGTLDGGQAGKLDAAWGHLEKAAQKEEAARLEGKGMKGGPLNPEQVGHVPMQSAVDRLAGDNPTERARLMEGPIESAPGAYKPVILAGQRAKQSIAGILDEGGHTPEVASQLAALQDDIATTMSGLHEQGVKPAYIQGGVEEPVAGTYGSGTRTLTQKKTGAERQKVSGSLPKSFSGILRGQAANVHERVMNQAVAKIAEQFSGTADAALRETLAMYGDDLSNPGAIDLESRLAHSGHDIAKEMERRGFKPLGPKNGPVTPQTKFVPAHVAEAYQQLVDQKAPGGALKAYDYATRTWKHSVLAMSPMWQVGNVIGNGMLMHIAGGASAGEMAVAIPTAIRRLRRDIAAGESRYDSRLFGAGTAREVLAEGGDKINVLGHEVNPLSVKGREVRPIRAAYRMNEFVDNAGRAAMYDIAKGHGLDHEAAVQYALKAMGDFSKMTPLERNYVKRAIPFYAWQRHVTQLAFRLPIEHPARVAWTLHLSQVGSGDDPMTPDTGKQGLPDWMNSYIPIGGKWLSTGGMNPLGQATNLPILSPREAAKGLNPVIQFGAFAGLDMNLRKGRMNTRPSGTGPMDASGRRTFGPAGLGADARWLVGQTPIGRAATALLGDNVARYDTGDAIRTRAGKTIPTEGPRWEQVLKNFAPIPVTISAERLKAQAQRQKDAQRRIANQQRKTAQRRVLGG